jgi:UDP-GlcNAc:undecaprenyl-phosphate/decaprenyl-phosphate GlcNAc-1-phosphate transferase
MHLTDAPGGRKIHSGFIPSMGGIAFVSAIFIAIASWFSLEDLLEIRYFLAAFGLMFFVGVRDDLVNLTALQKLGSQMVAAYMVVFMLGIRIEGFYGLMGLEEFPLWLSYALTMFTIIALTNAFNLIDGLDGLAGTLALVSFTFLGIWFTSAGMTPYSLFSFAVVGGIASFLVFNWHPAKIFMGDTGSLSLGFALSVLTIHFMDTNASHPELSFLPFNAPIATAIVIMIIPIVDTARVFFKRISKGKSPMAPDKSHVHHFLLRVGYKHHEVTLILAAVKVSFIGLLLLFSDFSDAVVIPVVLGVSILGGLFLESYTLKKVRRNTLNTPPVLHARRKMAAKSAKVKPQVSNEVLQDVTMSKN